MRHALSALGLIALLPIAVGAQPVAMPTGLPKLHVTSRSFEVFAATKLTAVNCS